LTPADKNESREAEPDGAAKRGISGLVAGFVALVLLIGGAVSAVFYFNRPSGADEFGSQAQRAFEQGLYGRSLRLAEKAWEIEPSNTIAVLAAESAQNLNQPGDALKWYRQLEDDGSPEYAAGVAAQGELCQLAGRVTEAERCLKKGLESDPTSPDLNRQLANLLTAEGRRWEASQYFFAALKADALEEVVPLNDALMLANFEAPFEDTPTIQAALAAVPDDPLPSLGTVHTRYVFDKFSEGIGICETVIARHPDNVQAHVWLGRGLTGAGQMDKVPAWNAALPQSADAVPGVWHIRGVWAAKNNQLEAAARCFWEALKIEPNYIAANYQLGLALVELDRSEDAEPFIARHSMLSDYNQITHPMYTEGPRKDSLLRLIELSKKMGRPWEQLVWSQVLIQFAQKDSDAESVATWSREYRELFASIVDDQPARNLADKNPAAGIDLKQYPRPDWSKGGTSAAADPAVTTTTSPIRFEDIASEVGLDFTYFNGAEAGTAGIRIFETTGGGVASVDYDMDGWSDIYFTQGSVWPADPKTGFRDKFFRNGGGDTVADVTKVAGLGDANYSQGISCGDFDDDGFPDLYIANIGRNRLFHNNGDGTFTEASGGFENIPSSWTTSALMADLNGDGFADVYDVNYLGGTDIFDRLCGAEVQRVCAPSAFAGELDTLYLSNGDGTFTNATSSSGLDQVKGKGLGIIAADFDSIGRLSLFVANDGIANHYFTSEGSGLELKLIEQGLERGVALDYDSRGQACMGVAVGDYDGNQKLDLFVTNYYDDSNTLYAMLSAGNFFEDRTRDAKLRTPSFQFLGFGTQFMDADLDGWPDLVLTNGHVDDFSHENIPFRMRPQFYRNVGGTFAEVIPPPDADYMNKQQLGRGLSRLDFDRDGRMDFAVSHLDTAAALSRNVTPKTGHHLTICLSSIASARDAIGTSVTIEAGQRTITKQLTAGDGYQATNERTLNFGLGDAKVIEKLTVKWPSGFQQTFTDVPVDVELAIVERCLNPLRLPR
jgi:tetratricopeptide (TPR) repeat protein